MKCYICKSEMTIIDNHDTQDRYMKCENGCYHYEWLGIDKDNKVVTRIKVFDKEIEHKDLKDEILYWRENDRYLSKILTN